MKISILVTAYNHERYIAAALDTVLAQRHGFEQEIVLIDDASTDQTFEIASRVLHGVPGTRLVRNEANLGITRTYKKGFGLCTGDYVLVLEGDDYWLDTGKVQTQVDFLESHPLYSMCFHPFVIQVGTSRLFRHAAANDDAACRLANPANFSRTQDVYTFAINDIIAEEGMIGSYSVCCYRKKFLDLLPDELFDVVTYDWGVNLFMAHLGLLARINRVMGVYRYAENSTWSSLTDAERSRRMVGYIKEYDRLLGYEYTQLFGPKISRLSESFDAPPEAVHKESRIKDLLYDWAPPIMIRALKRALPRAAQTEVAGSIRR